MSMLYSCVARQAVVLAQYKPSPDALEVVAQEHLRNPDSLRGLTVSNEQHHVDRLVSGAFTYLVISEKGCPRQLPDVYLGWIREQFESKFSRKGLTAGAHSLDSSFGPELKQQWERCISNPDQVSQIASIQKKVDEVNTIMRDNIQIALDRGAKLDDLALQTEALEVSAAQFKNNATKLKNKMWWRRFCCCCPCCF